MLTCDSHTSHPATNLNPAPMRRLAAALGKAQLVGTRCSRSRFSVHHRTSYVALVALRSPTAQRLVLRSAAKAPSSRALSLLSFFSTPTARRQQDSGSAPPPLPNAEIVCVGSDCALEYIDLKPVVTKVETDDATSTATPTLVLLHGAPGTYQDFRYLIPHIQQQLPTARIIGINFPGFGGSTVDESQYLELLDAHRAARLTLEALSQLVVATHEHVFLVGHSFGGHAALTMAALALSEDPQPRIQGLVLLAAAGLKPHRVLRPRTAKVIVSALAASPPVIRSAIASVIKLFYTKALRFPSAFAASHFVAGIVRAGTTDFDAIQDDVAALRRADVPSLSVWSTNDEFMEDEIPTALAQALGSSRRVAFATAGHNIQKTRADVVATEMTQWIEQVLGNGAMRWDAPIQRLP